MLKIYPKATQNRFRGSDKSLIAPRRAFLKVAMLFLGLFAYIFGSLFQQGPHVHNMNVLYVDYDGGVIGSAVRDAFKSLQGTTFPTLSERTAVQYPTPEDIKSAVCSTKFWAALYTSQGASTKLSAALAGGSAATTYNQSDVLTYIWNEARYPAVADSAISGNLQMLSSTAQSIYTAKNGTGAVQILDSTNPSAISVFTNPWRLHSLNIQETTQGSRLVYNTLVIILILIQEFFYLGTVNALYVQFKIYTRLYPHRIIIVRNLISLAYTFVGSLCTAGTIWAFRAGWNVNSNQFALTWAVLWLFAHANFLCLDVFTIWLPVQFVPMSLITWIVFNVTSAMTPFELSPAFYRWAYVVPAHEVYQVLVDIWSRGCNPQLRHALPILFSLEISALFLSGLGVYRRCHYATIAEEVQENAFRERLDAAVGFEKRREEEEKEKAALPENAEHDTVERAKTREELADTMRKEDDELRREKTMASRNCDFGPSFDMAFRSASYE